MSKTKKTARMRLATDVFGSPSQCASTAKVWGIWGQYRIELPPPRGTAFEVRPARPYIVRQAVGIKENPNRI